MERRIDSEISDVMESNQIPGLTVAVSRNGKLLYSKGFGYARKSSKLIPMFPKHRTMTEGGASYVALFPSGYKSAVTGGDLGNVHVAVAANIAASTNALKKLSNAIARAVPEANVSANYDLFKGRSLLTYRKFDCS